MSASRYTPRRVLGALRRRLYSPAKTSVVLRRDLERPLQAPPARVAITVRRAENGDAPAIRALVSELTGYDRATREEFLGVGIGTCYVAVAAGGEICYMQWLMGPEDNGLLTAHTNLPILHDREALLENAFTPAAWRGQGIMASAMAQIAERGAERGARWVLTVVSEDNVASIKGCIRAGFEPYMLKRDGWRLLRHQIRFGSLPPGYAPPSVL